MERNGYEQSVSGLRLGLRSNSTWLVSWLLVVRTWMGSRAFSGFSRTSENSYKTFFVRSLAVILLLGSTGCSTYTLRNRDLWYSISVPKTWKPGKNSVIQSKKGDSLVITRFRDDGSLSGFIRSQRRAFQIEKADFVVEDEAWIKVNGRKAWRMVGTDKTKDNEQVWMLVFVNTGQYKYRLWFRTPSESFRQRQKAFNEVVNSFLVKIPEY